MERKIVTFYDRRRCDREGGRREDSAWLVVRGGGGNFSFFLFLSLFVIINFSSSPFSLFFSGKRNPTRVYRTPLPLPLLYYESDFSPHHPLVFLRNPMWETRAVAPIETKTGAFFPTKSITTAREKRNGEGETEEERSR